jgi:hypothetical protein
LAVSFQNIHNSPHCRRILVIENNHKARTTSEKDIQF